MVVFHDLLARRRFDRRLALARRSALRACLVVSTIAVLALDRVSAGVVIGDPSAAPRASRVDRAPPFAGNITVFPARSAISANLSADAVDDDVDVDDEHADVHDRMKALIRRIERRLRSIDGLLFDAASGKPTASKSVDAARPATLDELLRAGQSETRQSIEDIDKLLELADHPHPPGGT